MEGHEFAQLVQDALSHLYDHPYLQTHPLAASFAAGPEAEARGRTLHRLLLEAIQQLAPPPPAPHYLPAWRKHRYLVLRYVEGRSVPEIAEELGIGERQARRYNHEAVEALSSLLLDRHRKPGEQRSTAADVGQPPTGDGGDSRQIEEELGVLPSGPPAQPVPLREVVDSALATLAGLVRRQSTEVVGLVPPDLPPVVFDRALLRQALLEVLLHQMDAAASQRIEVSASAAGRAVTLSVVHGPCAASGRRGSSEATPGSTGARLQVAAQLLALNGGRLETDDPPTGAIRVTLPSTAPTTVLVVDDNPDARRLFRRYLGGGLYRVLEAEAGAEAVRIAAEGGTDVITLDVMMPSQDGWETLQTLRNRPETKDIPVLVCSVLPERELALSLGADRFLPKPITQQALLDALLGCLAPLAAPTRPGSS